MPEPARPALASVPTEGTLLAFDYGEKRIGVALGNTVSRSARALETIPNRSVDFRFEQITRLINEWQRSASWSACLCTPMATSSR